jgi:hypothetical protein
MSSFRKTLLSPNPQYITKSHQTKHRTHHPSKNPKMSSTFQPPQSPFITHRQMDEETFQGFSTPSRSEKPKPAKKAATTASRFFRAVFPAAFKPASTVPGLTAKPTEIREYLTRLLTDKHGLQEDEANRVVAGWKIGSGQELRQYGAAMYLDIFGRKHGWILFREVKMCVRRERRLLTRYPLRKSLTCIRLDRYPGIADYFIFLMQTLLLSVLLL